MNGVDPELERMKHKSKNCKLCGGDGQVVVFHSKASGSRVERLFYGELDDDDREVHVPTAMEVTAHCVCPMGRWIRERASPEMRRCIPDVSDIIQGRSRWLLSPPGDDTTSQVDPQVMKRFFKWATEKTQVA